jgi:hypothetical protein
MSRRGLQRIALGLVSFALLLGVTAGREWSAGSTFVQESDAALASGDVRAAIVLARNAAEAAVPFSPYPGEGYERLASIARVAEQKGDLDTAGFAWRAVRSAAIATRPAEATGIRIAQADDGILRLARSSLAAHGADESVIRGELAVDETPSPWLSLLVTFGALAFAATLTAIARIRMRDPWLRSR